MILFCLASFIFTGCRSTYYTAWEQFGKHKRDLLKDNVKAARDEQKEATVQFTNTLTRLKELYKFDGGELETVYNRLQADSDKNQAKASQVRERIAKVEQVAADMFREWEQEIRTMKNDRLASSSRSQLNQTRDRYASLREAMKRAERSMEPVLVQLRDQVLYLKHHLNAQAIGSLRNETLNIEKEIQQLIRDMNDSISEANAFIQNFNP